MSCPLRNILVVSSAVLALVLTLSALWKPINDIEQHKEIRSKQTKQLDSVREIKKESRHIMPQIWKLLFGEADGKETL